MKYSQPIGLVFCLLLAAACFLPWAFLPGPDLTISGMRTAGTSFGRPGLMHLVLAALSGLSFALNSIGLKRANVLAAAVNLAWGIKNYMIVGSCMMGDCPQLLFGLWLVLACSAGMLVMSLLPKTPLPTQKSST